MPRGRERLAWRALLLAAPLVAAPAARADGGLGGANIDGRAARQAQFRETTAGAEVASRAAAPEERPGGRGGAAAAEAGTRGTARGSAAGGASRGTGSGASQEEAAPTPPRPGIGASDTGVRR